MRNISIVGVLLLYQLFFAQTTLIQSGSLWKYLDNGSDQETVWTEKSFNDDSWYTGPAQLGYGDGDEATVVSHGTNGNNKYITTYFRKSFSVNNPFLYSTLSLDILRDDGAIVYINGTEVMRTNMSDGNINYQTLASSNIALGEEDDWHNTIVSPSLLTSGTNTIAVEIHQDDTTSSDISFDLKLTTSTAAINAVVLRGAYLQMLTPTSVTIKWRTDVATDSKVNYGTSLSTLNMFVTNPTITTEHEVTIAGLQPYTQYYYNIGTFNTALAGTPNHFFITSPNVGSKVPLRFWVIGDAGTGSAAQRQVRDAYYTYNGWSHADGWVMLGDNAYENGKDNEFQNGVFQNMYEPTLENTALWPAIGNHEYANNVLNPSKSVDYYKIFTLPTNAEAGGVPSGSESYYSYNYANVHFVVLDSYGESRDSTGTMAQWLKQDLAANTQDWTVAYFHHPPYTKGSHNSDNPYVFIDAELPQIRQKLIPILEHYGVDLVLNGHSHCYERSYLIDKHYGNSSSLNSSMVLDNGSGSYPVSCAYKKNTGASRSHKGTVYAVVGCSGKSGGTSSGWPHPAMYKATETVMGSLSLEINDNRLDGKFITINGTIEDAFTIMKNTGKSVTYTICEEDSIMLQASWKGKYQWSGLTDTTQIVWANPSSSTIIYATDEGNCIKDTFNITVTPSGTAPCNTLGIHNTNNGIAGVSIFPNPFTSSATIEINLLSESIVNIQLTNNLGQAMHIPNPYHLKRGINRINIDKKELRLSTGIYFLNISTETSQLARKIIIEE